MLGRATLTQPQRPLGPLERKDSEPTFDEPWQAQALAIADTLVDAGIFSATEWAETLGAELRSAASAGAPDNADIYYGAILAAMENLLQRSEMMDKLELTSRVEEWRKAYLSTPHGKPVELHAVKRSDQR